MWFKNFPQSGREANQNLGFVIVHDHVYTNKAYISIAACELSAMRMMGRMHFEERLADLVCYDSGKLWKEMLLAHILRWFC